MSLCSLRMGIKMSVYGRAVTGGVSLAVPRHFLHHLWGTLKIPRCLPLSLYALSMLHGWMNLTNVMCYSKALDFVSIYTHASLGYQWASVIIKRAVGWWLRLPYLRSSSSRSVKYDGTHEYIIASTETKNEGKYAHSAKRFINKTQKLTVK